MKIVFITNHSYMFWQFRRELVQKLKEQHEVVLLMPFVGHEEDFQALGFRCIHTDLDRRSINPFRDLKLMKTYHGLLKQEMPDMVVTYSIKPNVYGGMVCRMLKIPCCANVQGLGTAFQKQGLKQIVSLMYRMGLKKAKTVFFENRENADLFRDKKIISQGKIQVLPGAGINLTHYSLKPYPAGQQVRFLYLGRIMREKGMDELFYAVEKLYGTLGDRVKLDLVGFFEDEYRETVEALVEKGIVEFHGFQTEPRPFYEKAHCVVLPSWHEGMSNVLLEAAATGRPIITSNIPGCREAVRDGETGLLCAVKDRDSLYEAMVRLSGFSHEEREEMGKKGRVLMEQKFDKDRVVCETMHGILN